MAPTSKDESRDLGVRFRSELAALVRLGIGSAPVDTLRAAAPELWASSARLYPSFSRLSDVSLRSFLREAARIAEPGQRGDAATHLLGLVNSAYGTTLDARRSAAADLYCVASATFRVEKRYESAVLDEIAARAAQIAGLPSVLHRRDERRLPVPREAVERQLEEALQAGGVVSIYGEPGVGKSWLARSVLGHHGSGGAVFLQWSNEDTFRRTIEDACRAFSLVVSDSWKDNLFRLLNLPNVGERRIPVVVDNLDSEQILDDLLDVATLSTDSLLILTSRSPILSSEAKPFHVGDFTESEAIQCCRQSGLRDPAPVLLELVRSVGLRPLAIQQASLFLAASGRRAGTAHLTAFIAANVDHALDVVARSVQARRNLSLVYRAVLDDLLQDSATTTVLDILSVMSLGDLGKADAVYALALGFLDSGVPEVEFDAALYMLYNAGLLTSLPGHSVFEAPRFSALTGELIRDIRNVEIAVLAEDVGELLKRLIDSEIGHYPADSTLVLRVIADEMRWIAQRIESTEFSEWGIAALLSDRVWLVVPRDAGERPYFIHVAPDSLEKLVEGGWISLTEPEARFFQRFVHWYRDEVNERLAHLVDGPS